MRVQLPSSSWLRPCHIRYRSIKTYGLQAEMIHRPRPLSRKVANNQGLLPIMLFCSLYWRWLLSFDRDQLHWFNAYRGPGFLTIVTDGTWKVSEVRRELMIKRLNLFIPNFARAKATVSIQRTVPDPPPDVKVWMRFLSQFELHRPLESAL